MLKKIFLIKSTSSRFHKHPRELPRTIGSRCARCIGATMPRKKLPGKEKKN
jgi:hypothetical protein